MLKDFEKFTKVGRSFRPKISIRKQGQIGFNNGAIEKFGLDRYTYATLYMSKDRTKIAIAFTNDKNEEGAVKLLKRPGNYSVAAKSFFDYYSIDTTRTKNYDAEWVEEEEAILVNIK